MLLLGLPDCFPPHGAGLFTEWLRVITQFDAALCISQAVQADLSAWLDANLPENQRRPRLDWFHLGADILESTPSQGLPLEIESTLVKLRRYPTFLMVGTLEPRKGHAEVLAAFDRLWQAGERINLVIIGKQGWMVEELVETLRAHPDRDHQLFWMEGVSDECLESVYSVATCLIAASRGEGFGLPLIEAAQHGIPVIARDLLVFKEVAGEHAFYFTSQGPEDLSNAIAHWLALYRGDKHPTTHGMPWMTWGQSADALLEVGLKSSPFKRAATESR
jgi:glycosyltransferase involved in cell wall biosynthesis